MADQLGGFSMNQHYETDAGTSLTEVLVAIFIMGVGLLAILTLFPLGALNMAQAIQDDRTDAAAVSALALSRTGNELLSETALFVEVSLAQGSVDPDAAAVLRQKYEALVRQAADMEAQLKELQSAFPREQIEQYVGPLLAQIREIRRRIGPIIVILSLVERR